MDGKEKTAGGCSAKMEITKKGEYGFGGGGLTTSVSQSIATTALKRLDRGMPLTLSPQKNRQAKTGFGSKSEMNFLPKFCDFTKANFLKGHSSRL